MESILISIKKLLGIAANYTNFDADIIMHINTVFMVLNQLGVGPEEGFIIEDDLAVWEDFIQGKKKIEAVKTFTYLKVRLLFDPPASSAAVEAINRQASEYEWRLNVQAEKDE